jgi:hypothetical protein
MIANSLEKFGSDHCIVSMSSTPAASARDLG